MDANRDIWVWDFPRGTLTRLTFDPTVDRQPLWTPDGQAIIFSSDRTGVANLFRQAANGTGTAEQLTDSRNPTYAHTISPDGRQVVMRQTQEGSAPVSPSSISATDAVRRRLHCHVRPRRRRLSIPRSRSSMPKSRLMADGWPISRTPPETSRCTSGGFRTWRVVSGKCPRAEEQSPLGPQRPGAFLPRSKGRRDRRLDAAGPTWTAGTQAQIIGSSTYALGGVGGFSVHPYRTYDVSPDGRRFLMIKNSDAQAQTEPAARIVVVRHWTDELTALLPP